MAETQIIVSAKDLASDVFTGIGRNVESLKSKLELAEKYIPFAGLASAAYLSGGALKEMVEGTIESMDHLYKLSQQVGMTVEEITGYSYAAKLADISTETFVKSVEKLSKNMVGAVGGVSEGMDSMASGGNKVRAALVALGFTQKDIIAGQQNMPAFLGKIADKFHGAEDGATKTAIAMMLFGKSGANMIPLLNQGGQAIADMRKEAEEMGLVFGNNLGKQAEEINDNFKSLHARIDGFKILLMTGATPAITDFSAYMLHSAKNTESLNDKLVGIEKTTRGIAFAAIIAKNAIDAVLFQSYHGLQGGTKLIIGDFKGANKEIKALLKSNMEDSNDVLKAYEDVWKGHETQHERTTLSGHDGRSTHEVPGNKKEKLKNPITDVGKGADTIKTLTQEAMKAEQAMRELEGSYNELQLTLSGDTFAATLAKQDADFVKQQDEALRELQKIADERRALSQKGKLTPEASGLLDRQATAVNKRLATLPFVDAAKNSIATIANDIERINRDSAHLTTMAGLTGQGVYEAQISAIKAKYDALRKDPKTSQYKDYWDAEQQAAIARAGKDQEKTLAQQRGELAQLTGNNEEYYESLVKVLTIERDLATTEAERKLKQEQLNKARSQESGDRWDGLRRGLTEYSASARDMWQNFSTMGKDAAQDVENALTDALSGKDVNISTLIQQLNGEVARATIVRPLMGLATDALSKSELLGSFFGGGKTGESAGLAASAVSLGTSAAALDTSALAIETSSISMDTSAVALDTSALALDTAALSLEAAAAALSAGGGLSAISSASGGLGLLDDAVGGFFSLSGALAGGGPTTDGLYLVGENGPELARMGNGYVYNNTQLSDILSGASGGSTTTHNTITVHQSFDFRGADTGAETRLRAYAGVIKSEATSAAVASVRAEALRGGRYSRDLRRGV